MSIATYLTLTRVVIAPFFLLIYTQHDWLGISLTSRPYVLLAIWTLSELSDALDGYLARRLNEVSDLGKLLDPMADSVARISTFFTFTLEPVHLPLILALILMYRDFTINTLRNVCALRGIALAARTSGKIKAIIQAIVIFTILLLMIPHSLNWITTKTLSSTSTLLTAIACAYTLLSGGEYLWAHRGDIKKALKNSNPN